jgi:superfamily II DNA or RNA helicase
MPLTELELQDAYDTGSNTSNVINDFYVPVLKEAVLYRRLTGYFSSQVLALAARGIAGLIANGGKMKLITSPVVSEEDFKVLTGNDQRDIENFVDRQFEMAMSDINNLASTIAYDHIRALGWMLRAGLLEIKVLIPRNLDAGVGIFHSKVGIIDDENGNQISFSGSVNETAMGWSQNIEEFKVFRSWNSGSSNFVKHDIDTFNRYWEQAENSGFEAVPLPKASIDRLIAIAPEELTELNLNPAGKQDLKPPREYQLQALNSWVQAGYSGILEMATGTGKTFTARLCANKWLEDKSDSVILVTAPTQTVASQWLEVFKDFSPITTFSSKPWREQIRDASSKASLGLIDHVVFIAIQNTACTDEFVMAFNKLKQFTRNSLLIADEAHGLGAPTFRKAMNPSIEARLGLTATPDRWFDDEGTDLIKDYFGGVIFEFGLHEALTWIDPNSGQTPLCPYNYHPLFVSLDQLEMDEYLELTRRIIMQSNKASDKEGQEKLNRLMEKRASVLKKAHSKFSVLREILSTIDGPNGMLIYCSDWDQILEVIEIVNEYKFTYRTFTGEEGTSPKKEFNGLSERDWILENFENQDIQILIAMKCLDEGVDIPSAKLGIIMASTTNPREFIQRRGRLLRRAKGKDITEIYDMIVAPIFEGQSKDEEIASARKILEKELKRVDEFAQDANNSMELSGKVLGRMLEMGGSK